MSKWWVATPLSEGRYRIDITIGWGDCMAGCIDRHVWTYEVWPDGKVELVERGRSGGSSGRRVAGSLAALLDELDADRLVAGARAHPGPDRAGRHDVLELARRGRTSPPLPVSQIAALLPWMYAAWSPSQPATSGPHSSRNAKLGMRYQLFGAAAAEGAGRAAVVRAR